MSSHESLTENSIFAVCKRLFLALLVLTYRHHPR